jgi:hypothetical protein
VRLQRKCNGCVPVRQTAAANSPSGIGVLGIVDVSKREMPTYGRPKDAGCQFHRRRDSSHREKWPRYSAPGAHPECRQQDVRAGLRRSDGDYAHGAKGYYSSCGSARGK